MDRKHSRVEKNWSAEHIDDALLRYLIGLQQAIRSLKSDGAGAIKSARANEMQRQIALTELRRQPCPQSLVLGDLEVRQYTKENPSVGSAPEGQDIIDHAARGKRPFDRMPGYRPRRVVNAPESPDIATRLLLNLEGVGVKFALDDEALPVVTLIPSSPLDYLLLSEYSDALLSDARACVSPRCGKIFRGRARTCSEGCGDYLKKTRNRAIDKAIREFNDVNPGIRNEVDSLNLLVLRARSLAEASARGSVPITIADVKRRKKAAHLRGEV